MALAVSDSATGVVITCSSLKGQMDRQVGSDIYNFCFNFSTA